jgi:hypothetical protein
MRRVLHKLAYVCDSRTNALPRGRFEDTTARRHVGERGQVVSYVIVR